MGGGVLWSDHLPLLARNLDDDYVDEDEDDDDDNDDDIHLRLLARDLIPIPLLIIFPKHQLLLRRMMSKDLFDVL